jgi:hypothetical protein
MIWISLFSFGMRETRQQPVCQHRYIQPSARQTTTIVLVAVVVCPAALVNVPRIIVAVSDNDSRQSTIPA